jgi:hypothetical protein
VALVCRCAVLPSISQTRYLRGTALIFLPESANLQIQLKIRVHWLINHYLRYARYSSHKLVIPTLSVPQKHCQIFVVIDSTDPAFPLKTRDKGLYISLIVYLGRRMLIIVESTRLNHPGVHFVHATTQMHETCFIEPNETYI